MQSNLEIMNLRIYNWLFDKYNHTTSNDFEGDTIDQG